jgi:hypothetical protein
VSRKPLAVAATAAPTRPAPRVDVDRINLVNVGLMLASAVLACTMPFEVFLASYAILGPLHYLTQISWLHDRGWFTTSRLDWLPLGLFGVVSLDAMYTHWLGWTGAPVAAAGFGVAAAFVRHPIVKLSTLVAAIALAAPVLDWRPGMIFFGILLSTVVHVYVFTGLFILAGSMKSRSATGYASFLVFLACGIGLLVVQPATTYEPTAWARTNLGPFTGVVQSIALLVPGEGHRATLVAIGRFLGFAYTYHYLNWFSKTGIIRWHEISAGRMATIGVLWVASIGLYAWDYGVGLAALFFLSVTHVFLEFPLDARTAVDVVTGLRGRPARA